MQRWKGSWSAGHLGDTGDAGDAKNAGMFVIAGDAADTGNAKDAEVEMFGGCRQGGMTGGGAF